MPTVVKVGIDPKRQIQSRESLDPRTQVVTRTIVEYWRVVFDAKQSDPTACLGATDGTNTLPVVGDNYRSSVNYAWCNDVMPQLDPASAGKAYNVQVLWSNTRPSDTTPPVFDCQIEFDADAVTETVYFDANNKPIVNSADDPFQNQPVQTYYITTVDVSFKTRTFDETTCEGLRGHINDAPIHVRIAQLNYDRTFPVGTLLLDRFSARPVVEAGTLAHWEVRERFKYRPQVASPVDGSMVSGWTLFILDQGYNYFDTNDNRLPFLDDAGQQMPMPQYLDGEGGASADGPHYLSFDLKTPAGFTPLFAGIT